MIIDQFTLISNTPKFEITKTCFGKCLMHKTPVLRLEFFQLHSMLTNQHTHIPNLWCKFRQFLINNSYLIMTQGNDD